MLGNIAADVGWMLAAGREESSPFWVGLSGAFIVCCGVVRGMSKNS